MRRRNAAWKIMRKTQKTGLCFLTWFIVNVSPRAARPGLLAAGYTRSEYGCGGDLMMTTMRQMIPTSSATMEMYTSGTMMA